MSDDIKIKLSSEALTALDELVQRGNRVEALRRALGTERFLREKIAKGWVVLLRKGDSYKQLDFPE